MANPTTAFGWVMPVSSDLVTGLPTQFATFGQGVDTSLQYLLGGTTGQILSKTSATGMAFTWIAAGMTNPLTTTGDVIYSSSGTTAARLPIGTTNQVLGITAGVPAWSASARSTLTATGDILYASSANTLARAAIGTTGQVLTVAAGIPSWATASAGGMTLINAGGTALSGSSVSITSIPATYKNLQVIIRGFQPGTIDTICKIGFNTDTGSTYASVPASTVVPNGGSAISNVSTGIQFNGGAGTSNDANALYNLAKIEIPDYTNTTTYKTTQNFVFDRHAYAGVTAQWALEMRTGVWSSTAAISSIQISINSGTWSAGTVFVYGVS